MGLCERGFSFEWMLACSGFGFGFGFGFVAVFEL